MRLRLGHKKPLETSSGMLRRSYVSKSAVDREYSSRKCTIVSYPYREYVIDCSRKFLNPSSRCFRFSSFLKQRCHR